ncbi:MAG: MFS transporter [Alphaproteobacteria bacterium]|nr:MFS transporter [Alphaproteobacteria bacterium]MDE2109728.1 MFS transporter [Alphaproteobacteria bacterium]MDE2494352.1 MFS transporter [Alphaproteobacteria bacterium]
MNGIARRLGMSQAASGLTSGVFTPFFGAWLAWRGLSADQIAVVLSAGLLLRVLVGPAVGIIADARNDRRTAMLVLYWVMLIGYGVLNFVAAPIFVVLAGIFTTVAMGTALPLLESVSVRLSERYGFDYGRVRLWASSAFVVANILSGATISVFGFWTAASWLASASGLCVVTTLLLPKAPADRPPVDLSARLKATFGETRELLRSGVFLLFLAAASFDQASHAFYYGYGGLHWRALGYSGLLIGILWPIGVFAEIALLSQARRVLRVIGPTRLLLYGGLGCVVRWTILAFDPPLPFVVLAQLLHGATFALAHLGAMFFILRAVPPRLAATAQSLYFVCYSGLVMGLATFASGSIYAIYGGRAYLLMSAMGAVAMGFALLLARRWHGERIIHSADEEHPDTI